jgi:hypothetical protein
MNRFGLKDLILLALVLAVGVLVTLDLVQRDRGWMRMRLLEARIAEVARGLEQVRGFEGTAAPRADDSWARPGVHIQRQRPWTFVSDPRAMPGYRTGGEVCELLEEPPTTIVPYLHQNLASGRVVDQVVQTLAVFDPETLRLRGVLAEAWQYDPAGLWLRVKIRPRRASATASRSPPRMCAGLCTSTSNALKSAVAERPSCATRRRHFNAVAEFVFARALSTRTSRRP